MFVRPLGSGVGSSLQRSVPGLVVEEGHGSDREQAGDCDEQDYGAVQVTHGGQGDTKSMYSTVLGGGSSAIQQPAQTPVRSGDSETGQ
jgi:hypothetical protein